MTAKERAWEEFSKRCGSSYTMFEFVWTARQRHDAEIIKMAEFTGNPEHVARHQKIQKAFADAIERSE